MKLIILTLAGAFLVGSALAQSKVQDQNLFRKNNTNVMVVFTESQDSVYRSISTRRFATRGARIQALKRGLQTLARRTHADAIRGLRQYGVQTISLWITNQLYVKGADPRVISYLSSLPSVSSIEEEIIHETGPVNVRPAQMPTYVTWGVARINAPSVWNDTEEGTMGEGAIVGIIDSGARATHEALRDNFVGVAYGWMDFMNDPPAPEPVDDHGHGTHCTGTTTGSNGIGVAPRARWMHCRACLNNNRGGTYCTDNALTQCAQWMLCPTRVDGSGEDCERSPDVISNSWGGGQGSSWYNYIMRAWETAGIFHVFSIGNSGPNCGTANSPGDQDTAFSVGASDVNDQIAGFSSRGPAIRTGNIVPNICAPGVEVISAAPWGDDVYQAMDGTSMACPHVSGAGALIIAKRGRRAITPQQVRQAMIDTTFKDMMPVGQNCGGIPEDQYPNHIAGHGRLDIKVAYDRARSA